MSHISVSNDHQTASSHLENNNQKLSRQGFMRTGVDETHAAETYDSYYDTNPDIEPAQAQRHSDAESGAKRAKRQTCIKTAIKVALLIATAVAVAGTLLGLHYGGVISMDQLFNHTFTTWQSLAIFGGGGAATVAALYIGNKVIDYLLRSSEGAYFNVSRTVESDVQSDSEDEEV